MNSTLVKRRITQLRYFCETTLTTLCFKVEIDKIFHSTGLLELMQREAPTFDPITLEFLITLVFKLQRMYIDGTRYYYGTLKFLLFNQNHELIEEDLGSILQLPIYGPSDVPKEFDDIIVWCSISGNTYYTAMGPRLP